MGLAQVTVFFEQVTPDLANIRLFQPMIVVLGGIERHDTVKISCSDSRFSLLKHIQYLVDGGLIHLHEPFL